MQKESLRFMQTVQVNGAAHESPGHNYFTSICKFGQFVRSASIRINARNFLEEGP